MEPQQSDLTAIDEFLKEYPDAVHGAAHAVLADYNVDDTALKYALEGLALDTKELDATAALLNANKPLSSDLLEWFLNDYPYAKYGPAKYVLEGYTDLFSVQGALDDIKRKQQEIEATITFLKNFRFWSCQQRACHSLQEISYRACFRPQLPAYFIKQFCHEDSAVYDPFMGRGTTLIEAQLHGCRAIGNDSNPLSKVLVKPRLNPPDLLDIRQRIAAFNFSEVEIDDERLLAFFHINTLKEIYNWKDYFWAKQIAKEFDAIDEWLQMVVCNRLTGHSNGFFSVYTLPPNQTASVVAQNRINNKYNQQPEYRDTKALIYKKSKQLLADTIPYHYRRNDAILFTESADNTLYMDDASVDLVVTSPPFLDTVNYIQDNWMRMWFCDIDVDTSKIWQLRSLEEWTKRMTATFFELCRLLHPDGRIVFELGEVRKQTIMLDEAIIESAKPAGLIPERTLINDTPFTKTANCWGVDNNEKGTNSNRIVVLRKGI